MHLGVLALIGACRTPPPAPGGLPPTPDGSSPEALPPRVEELARARIVAVGDIMMHGMVQRSAAEHDVVVEGQSTNHGGFDALYAGVSPRLREADLAFGNLETPIAPTTGKGVQPMVFNAPPVLLASLADAGFDVLSGANNHSYDQGRKGLTETLQLLEGSGMTPIGVGSTCADARRARILKAGELSVAFIGSSDLYNQDLNAGPDATCVFTLDEAAALAEAADARTRGAELVVLSIHWGVEYETTPEAHHAELARRLVEGGIDVILGHHPHVVQPVEVVTTTDGRTALIVFSMGNFVSNQSAWYQPGLHKVAAANPRDGLLVAFDVVRRRYGRGEPPIVRTELAELEVTPLWTLNNTHTRRGAEPVDVRVESTIDRIRALEAALASEVEPARIVALTRDLEEMERRWVQVGAIVGEGLLPPRIAPTR